MASPADLDRLRALLAQLARLGAVRRGEPIRADDWNALVGALADVARAVLAAEAADAVPPHRHPDEVDPSWLAPALRELLERGPLADPAMQQRLAAIEQAQRRLAQERDAAGGRIDEFRGRLTDVAARDLERQAALTAVRRQLDAVVDPRPELLAMRGSIGAVQRDIGSVLEAAARLSVDGAVVDIGAVIGRVGELEAFRERLRLANGELLDAAAVERRLAEVEQRALTPDLLDERLKGHRFELSEDQTAVLEDRISARQREQLDGALQGFRGELDARVDARLDGLGELVAGRLADALPGVEATVEKALGARVDAARQAAVDAAAAAATRAIDASAAALRGEIGARIDALDAGIGRQIDTRLATQLASSLSTVTSRLDGVASRLDVLAKQSGELADTQKAHAGQLGALPQTLAALRGELRAALQEEVGLQATALARQFDERLTAFARDNDLKLGAMREQIATQAVDAARQAAVESSRSSSAALRTQLLAEVRGVARDEVALAVDERLRSGIDRAVDARFAALPGLVSDEVRRQRVVARPDLVVTPAPLGPR